MQNATGRWPRKDVDEKKGGKQARAEIGAVGWDEEREDGVVLRI